MKNNRLINLEKPNLLRDTFSYKEVPKIKMENKIITPDMPEDIWITDTTFRDGQQSMAPFKEDHIVKLYKYLNELGGKKGLIRQTEFFLYSDRDRRAVESCKNLGLKFPEITSWMRASKKDFELVKDLELKETGILTSVSDYHIYKKLKSDRKTIINKYLDVVRTVVSEGIVARCHLEDITRADFRGVVIPFVEGLMEISKKSGVDVKIRLCDTMGYGVPFPSVEIPRSVPKMIQILKSELGVPSRLIEWHGHNDFHKVLVNGTAAWMYGAAAVNGTLVGIGERTGNPPIEGLIMDYMSLKGHDETINTKVITDIARFMQNEMGIAISRRYPFIGEDFNVTRAGIHADGAIKNEEIYNIFDTTTILDRPLKVSITDKSGVAGITHWINANLNPKEKISKKHPKITKIYRWIDEQYDNGRTTAISNDEMYELTRKHMPELFKTEFEKIGEKTTQKVKELIKEYAELPEIKSMDYEKICSVLSNVIEENKYIQMVYMTDAEGIQITENISQKELKKKSDNISKKGDDRTDRPWFSQVLSDGKTHVTDYYISETTGKLCFTASTPVTNEKDEFVAILAMDFNFNDLTGVVEKEEEMI
ncbi:MAG: triose-phosphate isomerase [Fusobacteriota bacterium]